MDSIRPHDGTRRRLLARGLAALAIAAGSGCATILYPERKGNTHGRIDVGPLILDILWFIPGIIPGVIAIAVDFATGAIYVTSRGDATIDEPTADGHARSCGSPDVDPIELELELCLVSADGRALAQTQARWREASDATMRLRGGRLARGRLERGRLEGARLDLRVRRSGETATFSGPVT